MQRPKSPLPPFLLMTFMVLTGLVFFLWHLAIHPDAQLADPGPLPPFQSQGIAPFVAVASRHDDYAAVPFTAVVHKRDRANFRHHLDHVAVKRGWYPHRAGAERSLVVPEADLHLLYDMERDLIGWLRQHGGDLPPTARPVDEAQLVNVTVRVKGQPLSGALRGIAVTLWVLAVFPGLHFLGRLVGEPDPPEDTTTQS